MADDLGFKPDAGNDLGFTADAVPSVFQRIAKAANESTPLSTHQAPEPGAFGPPQTPGQASTELGKKLLQLKDAMIPGEGHYGQGNPLNLVHAIPFLGPQAADALSQLNPQEWPEAVGKLIGMSAQGTPEPEIPGRPPAYEPKPDLNVIPKAKALAGIAKADPGLAGDLLGIASPRAAHAVSAGKKIYSLFDRVRSALNPEETEAAARERIYGNGNDVNAGASRPTPAPTEAQARSNIYAPGEVTGGASRPTPALTEAQARANIYDSGNVKAGASKIKPVSESAARAQIYGTGDSVTAAAENAPANAASAPGQPPPDTLVQDLAKSLGGKSFEKMTPGQQQSVLSTAERIREGAKPASAGTPDPTTVSPEPQSASPSVAADIPIPHLVAKQALAKDLAKFMRDQLGEVDLAEAAKAMDGKISPAEGKAMLDYVRPGTKSKILDPTTLKMALQYLEKSAPPKVATNLSGKSLSIAQQLAEEMAK